MNRFRRSITAIAIAACLSVCSASVAQTTDADAVIKIDAKHIDAYHLRGWARYAQGKPNEALKEFDRAVRIAPKNVVCYWHRAELLVSMGRIDAAKKDFDAAVRLDPNDPMALSARGNFWLSRGEWDKGIKNLSVLIRIDPSDVDTLVQRGWAYHSKGHWDKAIADLKTAIRLHPDDAGADYKPHAEAKLSPAALAHGQEQVRRMLKDRPNMARHVDESDVLRKWAARKFAGEDLGVTIDWDPLEPRHTLAQHSTPTDEYRRGRRPGQDNAGQRRRRRGAGEHPSDQRPAPNGSRKDASGN